MNSNVNATRAIIAVISIKIRLGVLSRLFLNLKDFSFHRFKQLSIKMVAKGWRSFITLREEYWAKHKQLKCKGEKMDSQIGIYLNNKVTKAHFNWNGL